MSLSLSIALIACLLGQVAPSGEKKPDEAAARLVLMKKSVAGYTMHRADDAGETYGLQPEPCLRFTNTISLKDGATVFVWVGNGRPEAATQLLLARDGSWQQELSSLALKPLVAEWQGRRIWTPRRVGQARSAPTPAATPEQRLRQMHALVREVTVEDHFRRESWQTLRMLSKPFARYGKPGSARALFAYVLTTDPEAYLMLEARLRARPVLSGIMRSHR